MKLKQHTRVLKRKALTSFITAAEAFNSPRDDGRVTKVLLHLQHAFEMLLKAALVQAGKPVFDQATGRSIGFERCIGLAMSDDTIKLFEDDAGTLRAIDAMRDDEQHWFNEVSEQILYLHVRAGVTLLDDILQRFFGERLNTLFPERVSRSPPTHRKTSRCSWTANTRKSRNCCGPAAVPATRHVPAIRTLLAMEAHVEPETRVSSNDVDRVEKGIRNGDPREKVFPRLSDVATVVDGAGLTITVHFTKKDGAPVHYVADDSTPAAAVRQIDLQNKYHRFPAELAQAVGLSGPRTVALRRHLGIDDDESCRHDFQFGSTRHRCYSDNALTKMRDAVRDLDMEAIWKAHNPAGKACPPCSVEGCKAS